MNKAILVNKENKIKDSFYKYLELVEIDNNLKVEKETYENYLKLKEYLKENNIEISINKAYIDREIEESEFNTALALSIEIDLNYYNELHNILHKFGFILRYPKGKENITGYEFNPTHIRYVGNVISKIIYENSWTLEEYLNEFSGVIVVNKEKDMTSFDVVSEISHLFGIKKVGHTGTLDPMAEGILIICIGKATKIVELLTAKDKEYVAGVKLGIKTDSYDITGNILDTKEVKDIENLEEVILSYKKTYLQEVPIYSAVKVDGKKLYEYARNNKEVELPKKEVTIKEIELLEKDKDAFIIKTLVSKGTYIRSLINDIGNSLNTYATMTSLNRTKQGKVTINESYKLNDIKSNNFKYYKIEEVLEYPIIKVDEDLEFKIKNGVKIKNTFEIENKVLFVNENNKLLGIYEKNNEELKVWKNF